MGFPLFVLGMLWAAGAVWSLTFAVRLLGDRRWSLAALNFLSAVLFLTAAVANFTFTGLLQ